MKRKRFSVEQITSVLQQVGGAMPVGDVCRQVGISEQSDGRVDGALLSLEHDIRESARSVDGPASADARAGTDARPVRLSRLRVLLIGLGPPW